MKTLIQEILRLGQISKMSRIVTQNYSNTGMRNYMTISNQGKTSNTRKEGNIFIKEDASYSGYCFQSYCQTNLALPVRFNIAKVIEYDHGVAKYRLINEKPWKLDYSRASMIGSAMGAMHRQCIDLMNDGEFKFMKTKSFSPPADLIKYDISQGELDLRNDVLDSLSIKINSETPKAPLHRDFRLHNILFDGSKFWLIDFDYAAIDIVSHEIVAMMLDISYHSVENTIPFIHNYIKQSQLEITPTIVDEHLYYLASDTFPYDRKDSLTPDNYNELCNERTSRLNRLKVFADDFKDNINYALGYQ